MTLLLLLIASLCLGLAAFGVTAGRVNLLALGLACWVLTELAPHLH